MIFALYSKHLIPCIEFYAFNSGPKWIHLNLQISFWTFVVPKIFKYNLKYAGGGVIIA
jgi:hypothetical protein